jgi:hypothetical protein
LRRIPQDTRPEGGNGLKDRTAAATMDSVEFENSSTEFENPSTEFENPSTEFENPSPD